MLPLTIHPARVIIVTEFRAAGGGGPYGENAGGGSYGENAGGGPYGGIRRRLPLNRLSAKK